MEGQTPSMKRIALALVALSAMSTRAQANVEIGGTAGVHIFSDTNSLGRDTNKTYHQVNSSFFGLRFGFYFSDMLGLELEGGLIPTESSGGTVTFDIYDAVGRANIVAQFRTTQASNILIPFVLAGGGMMRVVRVGAVDPSLFKENDMGAFGYVGAGLKYRATGGWGVRADARIHLVPSDGSGSIAVEFEGLASLYREWGRSAAPKVEEKTKAGSNLDSDADGINDDADKCAKEAEDKDDFQDEDGCPDADNDADGINDDTDKCKGEAEDKDNFQDDDGCPDADNDADGVPDASDKCADAAETKNGFDDEDGCADEIPAKVTAVLGPLTGVTFKANTADLAGASTKKLDAVAAALTEFPTLKVEVAAHTDDQALAKGSKFESADALSQAQADAVKAYLAKKGVAEDRITAKGYGSTKPAQDPTGLKGAKLSAARTANRRVELTLAGAASAEAAPAPATPEAPKAEEPKTP
jgi:outer membrane protein OmpA-like peptidoglycan-associated protein